MAGDRPKRERKMSVQAEESAANAKAATALAAAAREDREAKAKAAKAAKSKPAAAAKKATKTKKRTVEKKSAAPKKKKAAPAKKPATKKTKTKKTDKTCPVLSVEWTVSVTDIETGSDDGECYKSDGPPQSKETLEFEAPAGAKWFTMREDRDGVQFGPYFELREAQEFNYDAGEDGSFTYAEAMKLIGDHEAKKKKDGPPMLHWGSVGGYSAAFELRKADGGALQFRFVDAQVEIRSPEEYEDCGYY